MRARALSRNWDYHTWLLERTLDSILAQTNPDFDAVVVCHDVPNVRQGGNPKLFFETVDIPLPERSNDDMCRDKVLKISHGVKWAQARGSRHVMFVDADDLVSRRLSAFAAANPEGNGWYFHTGYIHRFGDWWLRTHVSHHLICGTCLIVRADLLGFDSSEFCRGARANTLANAGHAKYVTYLSTLGKPVHPLPFSGAVYILHDDSTSEVPSGIGYRLGGATQRRPFWHRILSSGRRTLKALPTIRPITAWLRAEYSLPYATFAESRSMQG